MCEQPSFGPFGSDEWNMKDTFEVELGPWIVASLDETGIPVSNGAGVHFQIRFAGDVVACTVSRQALEALELGPTDDLVAAYRAHRTRIDELAAGLVAMGFRAPRVVVRLHHVAH
jgi:hypothetical protein